MVNGLILSFFEHLADCSLIRGVEVQEPAAHDPFVFGNADIGYVDGIHSVLGLQCKHELDTQLPRGADDKCFRHNQTKVRYGRSNRWDERQNQGLFLQ